MKCPHCLQFFPENWSVLNIGDDPDSSRWRLANTQCAACQRWICVISRWDIQTGSKSEYLAKPKGYARSPLPNSVPEKYADDYKEACLVLSDSPKASAALSRRCLQNLLREYAKVKPSDLANEIQEVLDSGKLPTHLADSIDAVRNYGNFAAHPNKSKHTGEIIDVEPGEAEWSLEALEGLFDFLFVQPAKLKEKKEALNKKLKEAGKPEMK